MVRVGAGSPRPHRATPYFSPQRRDARRPRRRHAAHRRCFSRTLRARSEGASMKEGTATVHTSIVREFMHVITAQAKAALAGFERPGLLQISRLHPSSESLIP